MKIRLMILMLLMLVVSGCADKEAVPGEVKEMQQQESVTVEETESDTEPEEAENLESADDEMALFDPEVLLEQIAEERAEQLGSRMDMQLMQQYVSEQEEDGDLLTTQEAAELLENNGAKPQSISKQAAIADVDLCFRMLKSVYGAYYYWGEETFQEARETVLEWVEGMDSVPVSELEQVLRNSLDCMVDGHSYVGVPYEIVLGRYSFYYCDLQVFSDREGFYILEDDVKWYINDIGNKNVSIGRLLTEDGMIYYSPVMHCKDKNAPKATKIKLKNNEGESFTYKVEWVRGENYAETSFQEPMYVKQTVEGISYIALRSFEVEENKEVFELFVKDAEDLRESKLIIWDLRSNGGGNDEVMYRWVETFSGVKPALTEVACNRNSLLHTDGSERMGFTDVISTEAEVIPNDIPIVVLIDENCCSAGESALNLLKLMQNVTVVGSNSFGAQLGGNAVNVTLPNSKIPCNIGTSLRFFYDGTNVDLKGYTPDVWCNPAEALDATLEFLVQNKIIEREVAEQIGKE